MPAPDHFRIVDRPAIRRPLATAALALALVLGAGTGLRASSEPSLAVFSPFLQALAAEASQDDGIAAWYRQTGYRPVWTSASDAARREALFSALATAADHGLPVARYDADGLRADFAAARTEADLARLEVAMTRTYLTWARDLTSGMLDPKTIDKTIVREIDRPDPLALMAAVAGDNPEGAMAALLPKSNAYAQLMMAKFALEEAMATDGWGDPVPGGGAIGPGQSGQRVVALRDRLIAMGYLAPTATRDYDRSLEAAVMAVQSAHGLAADGIANAATLAEINTPPQERLKSVIVAMERERWMHIDKSGRIIWVNLPDMTAKIIDDGQVTLRTRSVIGREDMDRRTPEFSDVMEHMVVNPSWGVPRSITVKEYLPLLQRNRNAVSHLQVVDSSGRVVPRGAVNFAAYSAKTFPFSLRQPPSDGNALGKVKFMFPNPYNIYLHDTPAKALFAQDRRAYSHGCIRLADPFDFAHALLSVQSIAVEEEFNGYLKTGQESTVKFLQKIPVHLVYFTAYPEGRGRIGYREDVYGRDALIWQVLADAGVAL